MSDTEKSAIFFTALTVPEDVRVQAGSLPRKGIDGHKWVHPDDLHITLRYLGPVTPAQIPAITERLSSVKRPAFYVDNAGLDLFKNRRQTILFSPVQSIKNTTTLCAEITDKLTPLDFDFGTRPFTPHITLGRFKKRENKKLEHYIARHKDKISGHWYADAFHLMQSATPDDKGRRYRICESFPLKHYA